LHFSVHGGGLEILQLIKKLNKRIILWPNLWLINRPNEEEAILIKKHFDISDLIVFKSISEKNNVLKYIECPEEKIIIVPTGVDSCYKDPADPNMFRTIYKVDEYILWLGILEERKNQLQGIKALKDIDLPVVFIGNYRDEKYYRKCVDAAPEHFKFLPVMPPKSEILRSAIQNCKIYLETPLDHPGKSALEAGIAGAKLVLSNDEWSKEHFQENARYVDPKSTESILNGITDTLEEKKSNNIVDCIEGKHLFPNNLKPIINIIEKEI
jgi:glycosyltransferase involved in cell wall biosynthesis